MTNSQIPEDVLRGWFSGRLPNTWFDGPVELVVDREELTIIGTLPAPALSDDASSAERTAAVEGRIKAFREDTRQQRIEIAREAEHRWGRKVAWGVQCDGRRVLFTSLSIPVMTRLRQPERRVLDTLVEAGVARSRSDALAWSVRLVGQHAEAWLGELRAAMEQVERVRAQGPQTDSSESRRSDSGGDQVE
jgi:hypothetical protein